MNLDSLSSALSHISYSVANLTKKNFKGSVQEITRLVAQHGLEAERHLLRCLFSHVDFSGDGKSSGKDFHQTQYLIQECSTLINKPTFVSLICSAIENPLPHQKSLKPTSQLFPQIGKVLKLNKVQEVVFGIAFLATTSELWPIALQFVRNKFPDLLRSYIDASSTSAEGGLQDCSPEVLHFLLDHLLFTSKDKFGIGTEQKDAFLKALQKDFPRERVPTILSPLLYLQNPEYIMDALGTDSASALAKTTEATIAEMFREIGYEFTMSVEDFKNNLMQLGFLEITPTIVARIITTMIVSHTGLGESIPLQNLGGGNSSIWSEKSGEKAEGSQLTTWNIDVFIKVIQEMNPTLEWKDVIAELDHPGFMVKDRQGVQILWHILKTGVSSETFPVSQLYRHWRNTEGQLSLFQQLIHNCDLVFLLDYPCCTVLIDALKAPPEDDQKLIATWKNLDLIEVLLHLADCGHYAAVQELFKIPVQHCPDLLILGLLQVSGPLYHLRQELINTLLPIFFGNHPNSAIILHNAWHTQTHNAQIRPIIMHCMADWYMRGESDQNRLSRILDVAQDLKALSMLLNINHYPFIIDLACLASRREYLKLDKWMNDKIREHGESFVQACITFLKNRCPKVLGLKEDSALPKCALLTPETVNTIMGNLQQLVNGNVVVISPETAEAILTISSNRNLIINKSRIGPPGVIKPQRIEPSFPVSGGFGNVSMDPSSVSNMSLTSTAAGQSSLFPINSFTSPPSKLLTTTSTQNPLSSVIPALSSQFANTQLGDMSSIFPEMPQVIPKEVEDEANSYFQRIYNKPPNSTLSIDDVLELLKRYKDSQIQREREVFICMVRNLFEEYRFFPHYPDKELMTTAQLFGGIIEHQLITYVSLGLALRYVLDALRKPPGNKMYYFGTMALERFKHRLKEYPQYCQHLASIPHFNEFPTNLIEYVEYGMQSQEPPSSRTQSAATAAPTGGLPNTPLSCLSQGFVGMGQRTAGTSPATTTKTAAAASANSKPSIANATNIDTLLVATEKDDKIMIPPENVQDKIAFIINNLSLMNLSAKTEEFKEVVKEEYLPWVAQYIVMKRASIEGNFHLLYASFLDTLKIEPLTKLVLTESFRNIKVLLRSDKGVSNFSDRSLLKNLGHWLGVLTLAKNKPILQLDIDIKSLLIEAYHKGQQELLYVVPFVAKVLESAAKSKVFRPPNPWTMGIMKVLAELLREPDLKLNLKFEIEVLCKTLNLDANELKPGEVLQNMEILSRIEPQLSPITSKPSGVVTPMSTPQPVSTAHVLPPPPVPVVAPEETLGGGVSTPTSSTTPISVAAATSQQQPQFSFQDINALTSNTLSQFININPHLPLFHSHPQLKPFVAQAINRAIHEWMQPVVERSLKIAVATSEQIIKKDFAMEPDESKMRLAAHNLVRNLTAGVAMITCRDPLMLSISTHFKAAAATGLRQPINVLQKEAVDHAATVITQDNIEIVCGFIQKTAVLRALNEFDKRISQQEYELRKLARLEGRRYCDPHVLTYQAERMPEPIRLKVGGITAQQMMIYEEIGRNVPGFLPCSEHAFMSNKHLSMAPGGGGGGGSSNYTDDSQSMIEKVITDLEHFLHYFPPSSIAHQSLTGLIEAMMMIRNTRDLVSALSVLQKVVESLLDVLSPPTTGDSDAAIRLRDAHIQALKALSDQCLFGSHWTAKQVTRILVESRDEYRYNLDAFDALLRIQLINVPSFDLHLAQVLDSGVNYVAVNFAMQLLKFYLVDEKGLISETDLANTVEVLFRLASAPQRPIHENLTQFVEMLRMVVGEHSFADRAPGGPMAMLYSGITQARDTDDPPQLHEKTEYILREWISLYQASMTTRDNKNAFGVIVNQMNLQGILKTDDLISRFFRISLELCVDLCSRTLADPSGTSPAVLRNKCFNILDAYVRLISLLVKNSGDSLNSSTKINLLHKILGVIAGVLMSDHEYKQADFQQLPYHRILIMLFLEVHVPEPPYEAVGSQIISAFCHTLYCLRPQKVPGFAYSWLELLSHRLVLGRVLGSSHHQKNWVIYSQLIMALFKFLAPFLRNVELPKPIHLLYKGTLKVLLVLLHDFPEFLCDYHYNFCDIIPANCIQMRNLILSAFPRSMRLPDPFTPNLKVDLLPEIGQAPRILAAYTTIIQPAGFKKDLDSYLKSRSPVTFLSELRSHVQVSNEPGSKYNVALINALVLYVGTQAIALLQAKGQTPSMGNITHSSHMDIFQNLAVDLDTEGRYLFLNAIANQLRYPNSHTHYFSCTLLYLFAETNTEAIQEQITRVLLERLIVNRPHPWGLLVTFIELIKNQNFKFWNHEFVRCAPEIEKLFESVARSCMQQKPSSEAANS